MCAAFDVSKASVGTEPVKSHTDPTNGAAEGSDGDLFGARRHEPSDSVVTGGGHFQHRCHLISPVKRPPPLTRRSLALTEPPASHELLHVLALCPGLGVSFHDQRGLARKAVRPERQHTLACHRAALARADNRP